MCRYSCGHKFFTPLGKYQRTSVPDQPAVRFKAPQVSLIHTLVNLQGSDTRSSGPLRVCDQVVGMQCARGPWAWCVLPPSVSPAPRRALGPERKHSVHLPLDFSEPRRKGP